ncbi:hypothetical protein Tco_0638303, partial [Tanacetum coccineum]
MLLYSIEMLEFFQMYFPLLKDQAPRHTMNKGRTFKKIGFRYESNNTCSEYKIASCLGDANKDVIYVLRGRHDLKSLRHSKWLVSAQKQKGSAQSLSEFPNKDMKEAFLGWFGKQIRQRHIDNDLGVSESSELFALACGPSQTPISVNSCVVNGVRFVVHSRDERRTTQNNGICSPGPDGEMYYGQLEQILEFSYLSFKTVLFRVNGVFDDEDLVNLDIVEGVNVVLFCEEGRLSLMSADVARGHGGDGGGDVSNRNSVGPSGCTLVYLWGWLGQRGKGTRKPNLGGRRAGRQHTRHRRTGTRTQFDLRPHMDSDRWPQIYAGIQQHLQKIYNGKKAALKDRHWRPDADGTYDLEQ